MSETNSTAPVHEDTKIMAKGIAMLRKYTILEMMEALETLLVYTTNLIHFPFEEKYKKIKVSNIHYQDRLGHLEGSTECMDSIGYVCTDDMYLRLKESKMTSENASNQLLEIQGMLNSTLDEIRAEFNKPKVHLPITYQFSSVVCAAAHSEIGRRRTMEDDEVILDKFGGEHHQGYFAVYDGHGGRETVDFVAKALHINIEHGIKTDPARDIAAVYRDAYVKTDGQLRRQNIFRSGTTAVSSLIRREWGVDNKDPEISQRVLYVANVGDSRAVLIRGGTAIRLSKDHKPSLAEEVERIERAGGKVMNHRVNGVLAVSRALGDHMLKDNDVVSPEPYCTRTVLTDEDSFLILACDGVWDVLSDQKAADFVATKYRNLVEERAKSGKQPSEATVLQTLCKELVAEALRLKTTDNVTVMMIKL